MFFHQWQDAPQGGGRDRNFFSLWTKLPAQLQPKRKPWKFFLFFGFFFYIHLSLLLFFFFYCKLSLNKLYGSRIVVKVVNFFYFDVPHCSLQSFNFEHQIFNLVSPNDETIVYYYSLSSLFYFIGFFQNNEFLSYLFEWIFTGHY